MSKRVLVNQPAGLGDILFCQKIAYRLEKEGYEVLWPVVPQYAWLKDYLETPAKFVSGDEVEGEVRHLPLHAADRMYPDKKIMEAKYRMVGEDFSDWSDFLKIKRNTEKEDKLFYEVLGLKDGEDYTLVSRNFGTPPNFKKHPMEIDTKHKIVELDFHDGYNLFDWCKVIENATDMYLIDSSINYIIEVLTIKAENIYLYTRRKNNFSEIDYLFKQKYSFIYD